MILNDLEISIIDKYETPAKANDIKGSTKIIKPGILKHKDRYTHRAANSITITTSNSRKILSRYSAPTYKETKDN